jgi:hypothetical protein
MESSGADAADNRPVEGRIILLISDFEPISLSGTLPVAATE